MKYSYPLLLSVLCILVVGIFIFISLSNKSANPPTSQIPEPTSEPKMSDISDIKEKSKETTAINNPPVDENESATSAPSGNTPKINCDTATLQRAIDSAESGSTIACKSGTWTWDDTINIAKPIVLIGSGRENTIIKNDTGTLIAISGTRGDLVRVSGFRFNSSLTENEQSNIVSIAGPATK